MDLERLRGHRDWSRKMKKGDLGTERTQEAGFPRKLALWIGKDHLRWVFLYQSWILLEFQSLEVRL